MKQLRSNYQSASDAKFNQLIARTWTIALNAWLLIWVFAYQL